MPGIIFGGDHGPVCIDFAGDYEAGSLPPDGFMDRYDWHVVQQRAGLRQSVCCECNHYCYPQELSSIARTYSYKTRKGKKRVGKGFVCLNCLKLEES